MRSAQSSRLQVSILPSPSVVMFLVEYSSRASSASFFTCKPIPTVNLTVPLDHNRSKQSILVWVWICVGALRVVEGRL